ncbi:MAG TPA: tripartite tricarboxylate transporter TctB family protein [Xanthobacteraceae bacterium]|nr:tripartite tricarboxylate transporter TctB family protein [Xanthobacteraceae bacterium]
MTDTSSHGASGPSHRGVEMGVAVAMIGFGAIVIAGSLQVGIGWGPEGPKAGFFPFYLGVTIILASIMNLLAATSQSRQKVFADWSQLGSVLSVVIPTTIYVFAVPWAGIYLSSLILIALFMRWLGRYGIAMCAAVSISVVVMTYLMFEKWFLVPLPKGPIEDWLGL